MKIEEKSKLIQRMKFIAEEKKKCPDCGKDKLNLDDLKQCDCDKIDLEKLEGVLYED